MFWFPFFVLFRVFTSFLYSVLFNVFTSSPIFVYAYYLDNFSLFGWTLVLELYVIPWAIFLKTTYLHVMDMSLDMSTDIFEWHVAEVSEHLNRYF